MSAWATAGGLDLREVVVLVPFAQLLSPARRAFALRGGWQPRVETTQTLAASLGPAPRGGEGQVSFETSIDRLHAARLLSGQSWVSREPLAFEDAVSSVVRTAHALLRASAAITPAARASHWQRGREFLAPVAGAGGIERGLARVALEWSAAAPAPATDALFSCRPGAWVVVQAGGEDPLVRAVMDGVPEALPRLWLDADAQVDAALSPHLSMARCDGFEQEAVCAAAQVVVHLRTGQVPVALVAQDRLLMRRVRALLERQGIALQDETGWTLSTTRAAAQVMALLRAASPRAGTDLWLDWLKSAGWPQTAVAQIEAACRREGWTQLGTLPPDRLNGAAAGLLSEASRVLQTFTQAGRQPLADWLVLLRAALVASHALTPLIDDDAGAQVLRTLHIEDEAPWQAQVARTPMGLADFTAWVDAALEDASFIPVASQDASVVVTPLARLM
ncbi:MAG TPA: hypothetical protein VGD46_22405, partial [Rhizobacter sp.]